MEPQLVCDSTDREAWLTQRMTGIGSSDAPAVLGLEKAWGSPFSVSCMKRGLKLDEPDEENELMEWGHYVEGPMIEKFSAETGHHGTVSGLMYRSGDPKKRFMLTTNDGDVVEKSGKVGGIECKLSIFTSEEWEREGIPEHVIAQTQHTMETMGWDFMYVLALLDGYRLRHKRVERQPELLGDIIVPAETSFWTRLQNDEEFDAGIGRPDQSASFLKALHPSDNGTTIALSGDHWIKAIDSWLVAKEQAKAAKSDAERAKLTLVQGVGDATWGRLDDGRRLSLKTTDRVGHEVKSSTFRTLRLKK